MQFKDILKDLREEKKLSQKQVAEACELSPTCVCQLETGARNPTASTLYQLADFFECSTDYLLGREDDFGNISIPTQKNIELPPDEKELLELYKTLDPLHKKQVLGYVQATAQFAHPNKNTFITRKNK